MTVVESNPESVRVNRSAVALGGPATNVEKSIWPSAPLPPPFCRRSRMSASVRASARNADRNAGAARRIAAEHIESQISHVAVEALDALDPKIVSGQARHLWLAGRRRGE